jgi:hypothetical protein
VVEGVPEIVFPGPLQLDGHHISIGIGNGNGSGRYCFCSGSDLSFVEMLKLTFTNNEKKTFFPLIDRGNIKGSHDGRNKWQLYKW